MEPQGLVTKSEEYICKSASYENVTCLPLCSGNITAL